MHLPPAGCCAFTGSSSNLSSAKLLKAKFCAPSCRILRTTGSSGSAERLDREREQKDRVAAARRGMGSRIPSWLHLTALGELAGEGCSCVAAVQALPCRRCMPTIVDTAPQACSLPTCRPAQRAVRGEPGKFA